MATINHSAGADIIVPNNNGTTYRGLGGDDTYILSNSIAANAAITIVDTSGANKIQLVDGLSVASTKFAADAVQLTLSNGAVVTINGASNFEFKRPKIKNINDNNKDQIIKSSFFIKG